MFPYFDLPFWRLSFCCVVMRWFCGIFHFLLLLYLASLRTLMLVVLSRVAPATSPYIFTCLCEELLCVLPLSCVGPDGISHFCLSCVFTHFFLDFVCCLFEDYYVCFVVTCCSCDISLLFCLASVKSFFLFCHYHVLALTAFFPLLSCVFKDSLSGVLYVWNINHCWCFVAPRTHLYC